MKDVQQDQDEGATFGLEDAAFGPGYAIKKRKRFAQRFLKFVPVPWCGRLVHVCGGRSCCPDGRDDSVKQAVELLKQIVVPLISVPAANK